MSEKKGNLYELTKGIIKENPTLVTLLGMCPTLAVTTMASNGIGMGLSATFVLICSNFFISVLRKFIPNKIRIASYIVIIAGFVSTVEMIINAWLPELSKSLGLFIPLIVVNCIILARAEAFASKNSPLPSAYSESAEHLLARLLYKLFSLLSRKVQGRGISVMLNSLAYRRLCRVAQWRSRAVIKIYRSHII